MNQIAVAFNTSVHSKAVVKSYVFQSRIKKLLYFQLLWNSTEEQKQRELNVSAVFQVSIANKSISGEIYFYFQILMISE